MSLFNSFSLTRQAERCNEIPPSCSTSLFPFLCRCSLSPSPLPTFYTAHTFECLLYVFYCGREGDSQTSPFLFLLLASPRPQFVVLTVLQQRRQSMPSPPSPLVFVGGGGGKTSDVMSRDSKCRLHCRTDGRSMSSSSSLTPPFLPRLSPKAAVLCARRTEEGDRVVEGCKEEVPIGGTRSSVLLSHNMRRDEYHFQCCNRFNG